MPDVLYTYIMTELKQLYKEFFGQEPAKVKNIGGAGSNRRYFRLYHGLEPDAGSVIGVIGENQKENHAFLSLARHMSDQGLSVPRVFIASDDEMRYLQQDLGDVSLYDIISNPDRKGEGEELLKQVMRALPSIQFKTAEGFNFKADTSREPRFCGTTIRWDLNYFKYCFLKLTGYPLDEMLLEADFEKLTTALLDCTNEDEKWGFFYRDFQSRNVMIDDGKPAFIDFQGGYEGPIYYDVASFLWQTRANLSPELRNEILTEYVDALQDYQTMSTRVFRHRLRVFVFFRLLQVLGAYGFRGLYEKKVMFQTPIRQTLATLNNLTQKDYEPSFKNCSLKAGQNSMLTALFGEGFIDGNWGPDDSAGCTVGDDGYMDETQPAIDKFEIEEDCPYLCKLLQEVAKLEMFQPQETEGKLTVRITSFSYKKGIPNDYSGNGGGFVFDCRAPHNPGRYAEYKQLTGLDKPVIDFLEDNPEMPAFVQNVYNLVDPAVETYLRRGFTSLMVNFGCTGGQHRSVYAAQHLADHLAEKYPDAHIILEHREQHIHKEYNS